MIVNSQTFSTPARRLQAAQRQPARNGPGLGHPPCPSLRYLARGRRGREGSGWPHSDKGWARLLREEWEWVYCETRKIWEGWLAGWLALRVSSPAPDCFLTGQDLFSSSQNHPHYPRRLRTAEVRSRGKKSPLLSARRAWLREEPTGSCLLPRYLERSLWWPGRKAEQVHRLKACLPFPPPPVAISCQEAHRSPLLHLLILGFVTSEPTSKSCLRNQPSIPSFF